MDDKKKIPNMELPTVNKVLVDNTEEKSVDAVPWGGVSVCLNKNGESTVQTEAINPAHLTPDETVMTLNPNSVVATREFREYKASKLRK